MFALQSIRKIAKQSNKLLTKVGNDATEKSNVEKLTHK